MSIRRNVAANVLGRVWSGVVNFAFVPVYIKFLGMEAYGLVGFFVSLTAIFAALDAGISITLNRELARLSSFPDAQRPARDLLRSLEYIYAGVGIVAGSAMAAAAPWIAHRWLHTGALGDQAATNAIVLMGAIVVLRWPVTLYTAGFLGLQAQVRLNALVAITATAQASGAALVLWLIAPTIKAFFIWQVVAAAGTAAMYSVSLWRLIPSPGHTPRFQIASIKPLWRFAAGVSGVTLASIVLTQLDKVVLSKYLSLQDFGYYSLAVAVASVLNMAATAIYAALFPALAQLVANDRTEEIARLYHTSCQLVSIALLPVAMSVMFFSRELLTWYLGDPLIAEHSWQLLSLIIVGNTFLCLMLMPLALQLAYGWTRLSLIKNVFALIIFVPLLGTLIAHYGAVGAACTWIALTTGYFLIEIPVMHRRLLRSEKWRWYFVDVGRPLLVSVLVLGLLRMTLPADLGPRWMLASIALAFIVAVAGSALVVPAPKALLGRALGQLRPRLP